MPSCPCGPRHSASSAPRLPRSQALHLNCCGPAGNVSHRPRPVRGPAPSGLAGLVGLPSGCVGHLCFLENCRSHHGHWWVSRGAGRLSRTGTRSTGLVLPSSEWGALSPFQLRYRGAIPLTRTPREGGGRGDG